MPDPPAERRPKRELGDVPRRVIITVLILGALVGIGLTGRAAVTGSDSTAGDLPDSVERLVPAPDGEVPRQSAVGLDLAEGFDAYLAINGVTVRTAEDGLVKDLGTGLIRYQPAPGRPIEQLDTDRNCVVAFVWDRLEDESTAAPVSWCFGAY